MTTKREIELAQMAAGIAEKHRLRTLAQRAALQEKMLADTRIPQPKKEKIVTKKESHRPTGQRSPDSTFSIAAIGNGVPADAKIIRGQTGNLYFADRRSGVLLKQLTQEESHRYLSSLGPKLSNPSFTNQVVYRGGTVSPAKNPTKTSQRPKQSSAVTKRKRAEMRRKTAIRISATATTATAAFMLMCASIAGGMAGLLTMIVFEAAVALCFVLIAGLAFSQRKRIEDGFSLYNKYKEAKAAKDAPPPAPKPLPSFDEMRAEREEFNKLLTAQWEAKFKAEMNAPNQEGTTK